MMHRIPALLALILAVACATPTAAPAESTVRAELEQAYARNRAAMLAKDVSAAMALRTEDFHSITPDGSTHDRAAMEGYIRNSLLAWSAGSRWRKRSSPSS